MTKCDLCKHSFEKDGKLVCPYIRCGLDESEWKEILKAIRKGN